MGFYPENYKPKKTALAQYGDAIASTLKKPPLDIRRSKMNTQCTQKICARK